MQGKCSKKVCRQFGCADTSAPTLRKVREGWGTPSVFYAGEIKGLGSPAQPLSRKDFRHDSFLSIVILTEFMDFVVLPKVAIFAILPNVASAGIEERVVTIATI